MALTLQNIQDRIASIIDRSSSAPGDTTDAWNERLSYINIAQDEWAQLTDWQTLYKEYNTLTSTSTGNVSVAMPSDFRTVGSYPKVSYDGTNTSEFAEIRAQEKERYTSSTDKAFYLLGNPSDGYTMVFKPGTSSGDFASGASIFVSYYSEPAALASPTDTSPIPDPRYLIDRALALYWETVSDPRFPGQQAKAELTLQKMLNRENVHSEAANDASRIRTVEEREYNFRWGRD